jgi:DNA-binding transcriptional LysR family regulator
MRCNPFSSLLPKKGQPNAPSPMEKRHMLNLNQIRAFYHVAKNLSFTAAAKDLFITQPAVTAQIKAFEEYCELELFKKRGRSICMTDEGKALYENVRPIFEQEKKVETLISDLRGLKRGVLRLGTSKTYARYIMPFLMRDFHAKYRHIEIHLDEGSSTDMIKSLPELKNEVAIIAKVVDEPDVEFIPFSEEELILLLSPEHPLLRKKSVTFEEISKEPIIMKDIGSKTRKVVNELYERHACVPNILMETANADFIKQFVERGEGISFLVRGAVDAELKQERLATRPIIGETVTIDVSIAYLKNQPLSPAARAFLKTLEQLTGGRRPIKGIHSLISGEHTSTHLNR